ncbi:response regulator transcription factor [Rhizobacter sp. J219]|uniref:response regulator transcription factor n=1 Tax=Rhizobacter sp. J219 TaxID=2898430 RepID=UPI002151BE61|nr:response regulator transcription factor [Rhizobacter sp. J219]MCR5884685.1 response regulator transcription factor [Rhizobacter sp. J219]
MKLLLVDDHPLFGVGFAHALTLAQPGIEVQTALTLEQGLGLASAWPALEVVLIDYRLAGDGGQNGLDGLRQFGARHPLVARVLISGDEDPALAARARVAGAAAFLGKSLPIGHLLQALQVVQDGGEYFNTPAALRHSADAGPTARQLEVLSLIAQGRQNKQIARELGIAERTVKLHVTALFEVLAASNRTHLLVRAREAGLL